MSGVCRRAVRSVVVGCSVDGDVRPAPWACPTLTIAGVPGHSLSTTSGAALQNGGTYGIGAVVVARFDAPVGDRAAAEQQLAVSTSPPVSGAWHWVDDRTAHWRPPQYYAPGTVVTVGQDAPVTFTIGASHVAIADDATKQVSVYDGGALVRTMPTSMGRGGSEKVGNTTISFWTQPGVYTVMDKSNPVVMDSSTFGLPINSHLGYKESIPYAVRISTDGVYLHELDSHGVGAGQDRHQPRLSEPQPRERAVVLRLLGAGRRRRGAATAAASRCSSGRTATGACRGTSGQNG